MLKFFIAGCAAIACASAQGPSSLLLPVPRHFAGEVVDTDGKPVADARIEHTGDTQIEHETSGRGRFALDTKAPAVVIRKDGYVSAWVHTQDATGVQIVLQSASSQPSRAFPVCPRFAHSAWGLGNALQFAPVRGVLASKQSADVNYVMRLYAVKGKETSAAIKHGSGPSWTAGIPSDSDVWGSVHYQETTFQIGESQITDARGESADGKRWRYLGMSSESASYRDVAEEDAKVLDAVLDGACVKAAWH